MKGSPDYRFSKQELDWMAANLDEVTGWARGARVVRWMLVGTFLIGLAVHVLGFGLASGALKLPAGWPNELIAELLGSLGIAMWTSVVLVLFLEVLPNWQQRRAETWARAALVALRERGDVSAAAVEAAVAEDVPDAVVDRLDAILDRLAALEKAVARPQPATE
jgi:hypothetical protein